MIDLRRRQLLLLVLAIALLGATWLRPTLEFERATYRYVFVFDITESMNVRDVPGPDSTLTRLEYAKQATRDALATMPCGTEVGLALFAGHRAFLLITPVEVCANYRDLAAMIDNVDWRMTWEARSEVAKGVFKSVALLGQLEDVTRLVFFSDGHEAPPINPDVPPSFRGEPGAVRGLLVGVGGDQAVPIPKLDEDGKQTGVWSADEVLHVDTFTADQSRRAGNAGWNVGSEHLSSLRETYLQDIAADTGLGYHRLAGGTALARALKRGELGIPRVVTIDMRWLLGVLALLALLATLPGKRRPRRAPR